MPATIRVPEDMVASIREFIDNNDISLEVVSEGECILEVKQAGEQQRPESDMQTLYSGGWIACPTALAIAARLNIGGRQMGALANTLNIKIKQCSLGCF